jgi:hypothetical protein
MWVTFGKNPFGSQFRSNEDFTEIYWRMWVKHQAGWVSEPGNLSLSKIVSMVSSDMSQAMFANLGSKGDVLASGPGSCVNGDQIICSGLNDPTNTKWLPGVQGSAPIFSSTETGTWRCVEAHVALNTPGEKDGVLEFWVDGQLDASRNDLDFRGSYTGHGLNSVFFFNWYSEGSPAEQRRWMDDIVVATERIGCD